MKPDDRERPADEGMTLAELIVAMGIMVVVLTMVGTTAVLVTRTLGTTATRVDNSTQANLATASSSKVLRTAVLPQQLDDNECVQVSSSTTTACDEVAVLGATAREVRFYGNLGRDPRGPSLVVLRVRGTNLEQLVVDPIRVDDERYRFCEPESSGCATEKRVVARSLVSANPVFAYYDVRGDLMPLAANNASAALTQSQRARISSIDITVTVQTRPGQDRWPAFTSLTRVRLPNVEINLQSEEDR